MLDYQHIVDDVRSSLDSQDIGGIDFLRAAAADYCVACDEVNERLRRCGTLLRQGLRSEAIQLCEMEPNLLDAVTALDFPERSQWIEATQRYGMAPLPSLMLDVAADLNEAYALEQPLAALLKKHRLLALCHGPLASRIRVLRQLAHLDAGNTFWRDDLRPLELERHKQIEAEANAAKREGDAGALKTLDEELDCPDWGNRPPPALVRAVAEAKAKVSGAAAEKRFQEIAAQLESAWAESNAEDARALRDRWNAAVLETGFPPEQETSDRAATALDWLTQLDEAREQEEDHCQALAAFKRAIARDASIVQLQEVFRRAASLGGVPSDLEASYHAKVLTIQRAARRRGWLKISGIVGASAALLAVIAFTVLYMVNEHAVAAAAKSIPAMIDAGELEEAQTLVQNLPPRIAQSARVQEAIVRLEAEVGKEKRRKSAFGGQLTSAGTWADNLRKTLSEETEQTVLARLGDELDRVEEELSQASKLARTAEERQNANAARESVVQLKKQWQRRLDDEFLRHWEELDASLTSIAGMKNSAPETMKTALVEFKGRLKKWEIASGRASGALLPRIKTLYERLADAEKGLQQQDNEEQALGRIANAVGEPTNYLQAIQDFVQQNPDSKRTSELKRVISEAPFWDAVNEWNKLVAPWNRSGILGLRPAAAKEQISWSKGIVDLFAEAPDRANLFELLTYLEAISRRRNDERIETPLRKMFADPLVASVSMLERTGGERYYVNSEPKLDDERPKPFKYFIGFDGAEKGTLMKKEEFKHFGPAPQAVVAKQVQRVLDTLEDENWDKSFCQMIAILAKDRETDAILRARLLQKVLEIGSRGSCSVEKAFARHLQWFRDAKIDLFANWLDPNDPVVADARKEAARKLDNFPDIEGPLRAVQEDVAKVKERRITEYHWIGSLQRDREDGWQCVMNRMKGEEGQLVVVCRQAPGKKPMFRTVGQLDASGAAIDARDSGRLLEGRPVYLMTP